MSTQSAPATAGTSAGATLPQLADGVRLLGEYQGSGFTTPHYLIARGDGQVLHVSELIHLVATHLDGTSDADEVARAVGADYGRELTIEGLAFLLDQRLRPMGVVADPSPVVPAAAPAADSPLSTGQPTTEPTRRAPDSPAAPVSRSARHKPVADPLLQLRGRRTLVSTRLTRRVARVLAPAFHPLVVVLMLGALVAGDTWLVRSATLGHAMAATLTTPLILLGLLAALLLSTLFHEFGHAAACHRGGAEPGSIGMGLYVVYPAFFTDVTSSYRLDRRGRLRTDLGGVYFNAITIVGLIGAYAATGYAPLLLAVVIIHVELVQQLMPIARLDGYFVVADLVGVPDLFGRVRPILASLVPGHEPGPRVRELRRGPRVVVTLWVLIAVPLMLAGLAVVLVRSPQMATSIAAAERDQWHLLQAAVAAVDVPSAVLAVVSLLLLPLPLVGLALLVGTIARRLLILTLARAAARRATGPRTLGHRSQEVPMSGSKPAPVLPMMEPTGIPTASEPAPAGLAAVPQPPPSEPAPSTGLEAHEVVLARSAADFTEEAMLRPSSRPPARGWRRGVYAATRGGVNLGPSAAERREIDLLGRVRTPVRGCRRIVVISRKGGAGKTTTTLMLGHTLATHRGDRVVALDANPDAGSLAHRIRRETSNTVTNLLEERDWIGRYADMRGFTSQSPDTRLEVVASDDDPRITQALGEDDYRRAIGVLDRHYNLVLVDTGTGILDSAIQGILAEADQVVVVMPPALDGARVAAMTLDWLEEHHHGELVRGAVAVVNAVHGTGQLELDRIEEHFAARCRSVIRIPWDPVLQAGAHTSLGDLGQQTRDAYLELAAAVAGSFTSGREERERASSGRPR